MRKKHILLAFALIFLMMTLCLAVACDITGNKHTEHTFATKWTSNETHHWHSCSGCNEKGDYAPHDFSKGNCICGKEKPTAPHEHDFSSEWSSNETHHWHSCSSCDEKGDYAPHDFSKGNCICGKEKPTVPHEHDFSSAWSNDETHHWHSCSGCDEKDSYAEHIWVIGEIIKEPTCLDKGEQEYTCLCGKTKTEEIPATGHSFSEEWTSDNIYHWHVATCEHTAEISEKAEHSYDSDGNCVCGKTKPNIPVELAYELNSDGKSYCVTGIGTYKDNSVVIPFEYNGLPVTAIGENAFSFNSEMTSITIPSSISKVGINAFSVCNGLREVHIHSLSAWCNIDFGDPTNWNNYTSNPLSSGSKLYVNGELLTSLTIPDTVTEVKPFAFYGCSSIVSVTIHSGVESIGEKAFSNTYRIVEIYNLSPHLEIVKGSSTNGYIAIYAKAIHTSLSGKSNIVEKDNFLFYDDGKEVSLLGWKEEKSHLIFPDDYNGKTYNVNYGAFNNNKEIKNVTVSKGITKINENAFKECSNIIGVYADSLETWCNIEFSSTYSTPLEKAMVKKLYVNNVLLTDAVIPDTVKEIKTGAFKYCTFITSVTILDSVTKINSSAFYHCDRLERVTFGKNIKNLGANSFGYCGKLESIDIPDSVTTLGGDVFAMCQSLKSVKIGTGITELGMRMFSKCTSLTNVTIPDAVKIINSSAFYGCSSLTAVTIGSGVTGIQGSAFQNCKNISKVYYKGTLEEWNRIVKYANNEPVTKNATRYYYSEVKPTDTENRYWHYLEDGVTIVEW